MIGRQDISNALLFASVLSRDWSLDAFEGLNAKQDLTVNCHCFKKNYLSIWFVRM